MKALLVRLFSEETGAILSAEIMLVASVLVIGVIAGLSSLRDSVVTELADVAQALANFNQSYCFSGVSGHHAFSGGGEFSDQLDFCDSRYNNSDKGNSKCVLICSTNDPGEGNGGGHSGHGGGKW
jgi:Flp pilus assembly pilin Flp